MRELATDPTLRAELQDAINQVNATVSHGGGQLVFFLGKVRLEDVELLNPLRMGDGGVNLVDGVLQLCAQGRIGGQLAHEALEAGPQHSGESLELRRQRLQ